MKKKLILLLSIGALVGITLNSCKKEGCTDETATNFDETANTDDGSCEIPEPEPNDTETQSTDDHNEVQKEFDDVLSTVEDVMKSVDSDMDKDGQGTLSDTTCATVTLDTAYSANGAKGRITIDFGDVNCEGADGRNRRGKIYVEYTGKYRSTGTKITTTFDNFFVNDNQLEGTKTVETVNRDVYNVDVTGAIITFTDGTTITWESSRVRTWVEGNALTLADAFNIWNDIYEINGTASGVGRYGRTFTVDIDQLTLKLECWLTAVFAPVSGTITVTPQDFDDRVLDYGDGTCDKKGTITIGDNEPTEYDWSN